MVYILETKGKRLIDADIVVAERKNIPLKKDGWKFNWKQLAQEQYTQTFILKTMEFPQSIGGALHLKVESGMLIMDVVEIAAHNIGRKKKYDYVAGCLIAFACRESFKLEGSYKGFLSFISKTNLIKWYSTKYGATLAFGQLMFIDPEAGEKLINKYL
ncbi:hypothetical protein ACFLSY_11745 [Bacteroidota bacterium]